MTTTIRTYSTDVGALLYVEVPSVALVLAAKRIMVGEGFPVVTVEPMACGGFAVTGSKH